MKKDMYNIIASAILIIVVSLLASSCKIHIDKREEGGKTITSNYDIKTPFKGITINTTNNVDIIYTVSDSISVKAEGPENFVKKMTITVGADSMLCISSTKNDATDDFMEGFKNGFNMTESDDIKVYISGPAPSILDFKGAAEFTAKDTINVPSMTINVSGAAEINIPSLKAETAVIETSGAGDLKMGFVGVKNTNYTCRGASEAKFNFTDCDTASLNIMGAAEVELKGTLRHLDKNVSGAGDIDDDELKVES